MTLQRLILLAVVLFFGAVTASVAQNANVAPSNDCRGEQGLTSAIPLHVEAAPCGSGSSISRGSRWYASLKFSISFGQGSSYE
jgi:hypothetical protein